MKFILFLLFSIIFLASSFSGTLNNEYLLNVVHICLISMFFLLVLVNRFKFLPNIFINSLVYLYVLLSGISAIINDDHRLLINSILLGLIFILSFGIVPTLRNLDIDKILIWSILLTQLPLILFPLIQKGFDTNPYMGIFYNPNSFGNTVATLFSVIFSVFLMIIQRNIEGVPQKKFFLKSMLCGATLTFLMYLVSLSGSRTSFVSLLGMILLGLVILGYYLLVNRKIVNILLKGSLFFLILSISAFFVIKFTNFYEYLYFNIIYKFEIKASSGDVLDQRGSIWLQTLSEGGFFGQGSEYFQDVIGIGAHNTFINLIGTVGYLPALFVITIFLTVATIAFNHTLNSSNSVYKYFPFILSLNFLMLSMGETMLFKISMILMLFSISGIYSNRRGKVAIKIKREDVSLKKATRTVESHSEVSSTIRKR